MLEFLLLLFLFPLLLFLGLFCFCFALFRFAGVSRDIPSHALRSVHCVRTPRYFYIEMTSYHSTAYKAHKNYE